MCTHLDQPDRLHVVGHCCACSSCCCCQRHIQPCVIKLPIIVQDLRRGSAQHTTAQHRLSRRALVSSTTTSTSQNTTPVTCNASSACSPRTTCRSAATLCRQQSATAPKNVLAASAATVHQHTRHSRAAVHHWSIVFCTRLSGRSLAHASKHASKQHIGCAGLCTPQWLTRRHPPSP